MREGIQERIYSYEWGEAEGKQCSIYVWVKVRVRVRDGRKWEGEGAGDQVEGSVNSEPIARRERKRGRRCQEGQAARGESLHWLGNLWQPPPLVILLILLLLLLLFFLLSWFFLFPSLLLVVVLLLICFFPFFRPLLFLSLSSITYFFSHFIFLLTCLPSCLSFHWYIQCYFLILLTLAFVIIMIYFLLYFCFIFSLL